MEHIHPIFDKILQPADKEALLKQKGIVIWMVGLSGSGKSTVAQGVESVLHEKGHLTKLLDGDNLRTGVNKGLTFSEEDRIENIRRAAEVSKLFAETGIVTICSLISPTEEIRKMAKEIIGDRYYEVHIDCPFEVCAERDVKGLYAKALAGEIKNFTGLDSPFEVPKDPFIRIDTVNQTLEQSTKQLIEAIIPEISI